MTQENNGYGQIDWKGQQNWNQKIIQEFRTHGGNVGGPFQGSSLLLLSTTGAKSGQTRITPLSYYSEQGRLFIFATKAGAPSNPDWYYNLVANPEVTVELGTEKFSATAVVVNDEERARIYAKQAAASERFAEYERTTTRSIPVVELLKQE